MCTQHNRQIVLRNKKGHLWMLFKCNIGSSCKSHLGLVVLDPQALHRFPLLLLLCELRCQFDFIHISRHVASFSACGHRRRGNRNEGSGARGHRGCDRQHVAGMGQRHHCRCHFHLISLLSLSLSNKKRGISSASSSWRASPPWKASSWPPPSSAPPSSPASPAPLAGAPCSSRRRCSTP
jgi:hypothetical protein